VKVSEEAKSARKNVPKAIVISILISTIVYVLVSISAVSTIPWQILGESETPLALVASTALGKSTEFMMSVFALFATASTALIFMLGGSRMLFGMSEAHVLPKFLMKVDKKRKTPYIAVTLLGIISIFFVFIANMSEIALLVDFSAFVIFAMINLSAFALRIGNPDAKREFKVPLSIGRVPILPLAGFLITCYMLTQFTIQTAWSVVIIMVAGYIFYKFCKVKN